MKESDVRRHLITNLSSFGDIEAIENMVGTGNPDVNYCFNGYEGWIEVKFKREIPKRPTTALFGKCLKPSQHIWFRRRYMAGHRRIFIYGRADDRLFLLPGYMHYEFEVMTLSEIEELCVWQGKVRKADWEELAQTLETTYRNIPKYMQE